MIKLSRRAIEKALIERAFLATGKWLLLLIAMFAVLPFLQAYQWPLPIKQIERGFLAAQPSKDLMREQDSLPNLGVWFAIKDEDSSEKLVEPYHSGEIVYFETSSEMNVLGPVPKNISNTIVVQHGKLLFRYSGKNLDLRLQDSYQVGSGDFLFSSQKKVRGKVRAAAKEKKEQPKPRLYMEIFDVEFQTVINPKLIMPDTKEDVRASQPYLELVTLDEAIDQTVEGELSALESRPLKQSDELLRGIYNLSFRFSSNQGPPLRLNVNIDDKKMYSELFDQIYGINSKLIINDRDLQDIYILDQQSGKFFLGTINLQDKVNSAVRISVVEEYIDGSQNTNDYSVRIR